MKVIGYLLTSDEEQSQDPMSPKSLLSISKNKVEHVLMKHILNDDEENVEDILSLFQLDLSTTSRPEINREMCNGWTPLTLAAQIGNKHCVELLLSVGADVNLKNKFDKTALLLAVEHDHDEVVHVLALAGARINGRYKNENTMLMLAADGGNVKMAELLLELGANPNLVNRGRQTALICATKKWSPFS
jgi:ankyrin repeat protein